MYSEKQRLDIANRELEKELKILDSEVQLLEDENVRMKSENHDLRKSIVKLEKIVYGN
jgi:hypothetical protein